MHGSKWRLEAAAVAIRCGNVRLAKEHLSGFDAVWRAYDDELQLLRIAADLHGQGRVEMCDPILDRVSAMLARDPRPLTRHDLLVCSALTGMLASETLAAVDPGVVAGDCIRIADAVEDRLAEARVVADMRPAV